MEEQQRQGIIPPPATASDPTTTTTIPKNNNNANDTSVGGKQEQQQPKHTTTAEEWIDLLVQEMSAATDITDAKQRAAQVLRAFEQAVMQHADQHHGDVVRENALLKRAVAIQNSRLQELLARESEVRELRGAMEEAKAKIRALEVHNYSLQVHLKRATEDVGGVRGGEGGGGGKINSMFHHPTNPDVF